MSVSSESVSEKESLASSRLAVEVATAREEVRRTEDTLGERLTVVMPHDVDIVAGVAVHTRAHLGPRHIVRHPTRKMGKLSG